MGSVPQDASALSVRGLGKLYHSRWVLRGISFSLEEGSFTALIGQNGAGKSTLLRLLAGIEVADEGEIDRTDGLPGYVSESIAYTVDVPARQVMERLAVYYPRWDQPLFDRLLAQSGVSSKARFSHLSRGQRAQVLFAATIARHPKVLLLDEIASVLDANARQIVTTALTGFLSRGGTVLSATNLVSEVAPLATHLLLIHEGRLEVQLPWQQIAAQYRKLRRVGGEEHPVFHDKACAALAINSDGSTSYLVPVELIASAKVPDPLLDRRAVTAEDVFLYFTRARGVSRTEDDREAA